MKKKLISVNIILSIITALSGCSNTHLHTNIPIESNKTVYYYSKDLPKDAKIPLQEGLYNLNKGNLPAAIDDFRDLSKLYPHLVEAHYNLGLAYAKNNQMFDAIKSWEYVLTLDKSNPDIYYNLGQAYKYQRE